MKKISTYWLGTLGIACAMVFGVSCNINKTGLPSLRQTFCKDDTIPFGAKVAYNLIQQVYPENQIQDLETEKQLSDFSDDDTGFFYICIARNVFASKEGAASILNCLNAGNTYFISAENISAELLDTLGISLNDMDAYKDDWSLLKDTHLTMSAPVSEDRSDYGYFFLPFLNSFTKYDSASTQVLGLNEEGRPDFLVIFYGKGKLFLHCAPGAFSNYFLLQPDNYKYLQSVLTLMPSSPKRIYWDDYYYKHNSPPSGSGLRVLFQYPAMKWAFWLLLILLLLYIIFGGKRKQRIVPVLSPMKNTTVAYTETVSRLYLQKKDNKNIADKMITYFFEYIRSQFFLNTNQLNEEFIDMLSRKSAVPKETTTALFKTITDIQHQASVNDQQLLSLNKQIENFYKPRN